MSDKTKVYITILLGLFILPLVSADYYLSDTRLNVPYINSTQGNFSSNVFINGVGVATYLYNQSAPYEVWKYNQTAPFTTWLSSFLYNYNQSYTLGTYNVTYNQWAYNQTLPLMQWNYNQTLPLMQWNYNQTLPLMKWNYNQTLPLMQWNYNQTAPALANDDWNLSGTNLFPKSLGYSVGIGTANPVNTLNVIGTANITGNAFFGGNRYMQDNKRSYFGDANSWGIFGNSSGDIWINREAGTGNINIPYGNIEMGASNSNSRLRLSSTLNPQPNSTFLAPATFSLNSPSNSELAFGWQPSGSFPWWIQARNALNITAPIVLNPLGGNVGIGTTTPNYKLEVAGSINATGNLTTDSLIKFSIVTLPNCLSNNVNGSIGRNATGVYGCQTTGIWLKIY